MRDQQAFLARLWAIDDALAVRGYPRLSPWWRDTITDLYLSGARQAVVRKGRRVGASTIVAPRIAVCEALYGQHVFSPGDRAVFAFISVRRDEAKKRVRNIEAVLDALGVAYSTSDSTIRLRDLRIDFQVLTASYRTAVGDTCVGVWCDEVARWSDVESGSNPAREVLASVRPTIDRGRFAPEPRLHGIRYYLAADAAFAVDRFGVAVVTTQLGDWDGLTHTRGPRVTRVQETHAWRPDRAPSAMARRLDDEVCRRCGERRVFLDQFSSAAFSELCSQAGLDPRVIPWTAGDGPDSKAERYRSVRTAMLEGSLRIPDDPELIRDLRSVRSVLTPAGNERIELPRTAGGHADRVSAMVMAASEALRASPDLAPARETTFERQRREYAERAFAAAASGQGFPGAPGWF